FVTGFVMARLPILEERCVQERRRTLGIAMAALLIQLAGALGIVSARWLLLVSSALVAWCFNLVLLGFAVTCLRRPWRHTPYLAESAFPIYVLHQPVIVAVGYLVVQLPLGIFAKFILLLTASVVGTLCLYEIVRRLPP